MYITKPCLKIKKNNLLYYIYKHIRYQVALGIRGNFSCIDSMWRTCVEWVYVYIMRNVKRLMLVIDLGFLIM